MSVAELQKNIRGLSVEDRRVLSVIAARMKQRRSPAHRRKLTAAMREMDTGKKHTMAQVEEAAMRSVFGCARRVKPGKSSRQILAEMRGYERGAL